MEKLESWFGNGGSLSGLSLVFSGNSYRIERYWKFIIHSKTSASFEDKKTGKSTQFAYKISNENKIVHPVMSNCGSPIITFFDKKTLKKVNSIDEIDFNIYIGNEKINSIRYKISQ